MDALLNVCNLRQNLSALRGKYKRYSTYFRFDNAHPLVLSIQLMTILLPVIIFIIVLKALLFIFQRNKCENIIQHATAYNVIVTLS